MLIGVEDIDKNKRYLMNELSETAVQCKKIESDEKVAGDDREAAQAFAKIIANMDSNPFKKPAIEGEATRMLIEPTIAPVTLLPGESGLEMEELDYKDFVNDKK